jgi:hypothetical protein
MDFGRERRAQSSVAGGAGFDARSITGCFLKFARSRWRPLRGRRGPKTRRSVAAVRKSGHSRTARRTLNSTRKRIAPESLDKPAVDGQESQACARWTSFEDYPLSESLRTESDLVARQYNDWVYPQPIQDISEFVKRYYDLSDPSLFRRKLWPRKIEPENLSILVAGCGANQAAHYAFTNRNSQVLGIDLSDSSLGHEAYLKQKHRLDNLELLRMSLGELALLGEAST